MPLQTLRQLPFLAIAAFLLAGSVEAATPQIVSLTPTSGSGQTQTFTLTASDTAGASDISSVDMLINSAFNKQQACWMYFNAGSHGLWLASDDGSWFGSPIGAGSGPGSSTYNSQCTVQFLSYSSSGNDVSFTVSITFSSAWQGDKTIWGESLDQAKDDSGYQQMGTYTVVHEGPTQDFSVSLTPDHLDTTPGHNLHYNFTVTSLNGFSGSVKCLPTASPNPSGLVVYTPYGDNPLPLLQPNASETAQLNVNVPASTPPTSNIAITLACQDNNLQHNAQAVLNIATPETPTVAVSPTSGSGSTQTFTISASDPGGFTAIGQMSFLISPSFSGTNACWLVYNANTDQNTNAPSGTLALANDDTSNWSSTTEVDSNPNDVTPIFNSQCSVFGGPTTLSGSGDTLTLTLSLTFTAAFSNSQQPKLLYVRAMDVGGPDSGYQQLGSFTTQPGNGSPNFDIVVTPTPQSVTGQAHAAYAATVHGVYGYSGTVNISVTGLPPDSTLTPNSSFSVKPNQTAYFTVNTSGDTPTGSYTPTVTGTDGTLTNSQNFTLNVTAASLPTLSASPNSGSGTTQTFTFTSTGTTSAEPDYMNILFNTTVSGQNACWIYFNGGLYLASDDGTLWENANDPNNRTAQNSQCTVTWTPTQSTDSAILNATITFNSSFTGTKNIYMHGHNTQGGDTGYTLQGTWTIP